MRMASSVEMPSHSSTVVPAGTRCRADSGFYTHGVVSVCRKMDVRFSITIRQHKSLSNLIEAIPEDAWTPIPYWMDAAADVAETTCTPFQSEPDAAPVRLIVRRVKPTPGSQLALFASYSYHGFITDRDGEMLELEADHRRHAEIENAIRDLKHGVGLNHLPSGRFAANAAWLAVQVMAHNLALCDGLSSFPSLIVLTTACASTDELTAVDYAMSDLCPAAIAMDEQLLPDVPIRRLQLDHDD